MIKVFVYGTLMKDMYNNYLLKDSEFLGKSLVENLLLFDLGFFPGCVKLNFNSDSRVMGEVYNIDFPTLENLDYLEGYPTLYSRELVDTNFGPAYTYLYNRVVSIEDIISCGCYRSYLGVCNEV